MFRGLGLGGLLIAALATAVFGSSQPASAVRDVAPRAPHVIPPDGDREVPIPLCVGAEDLDCIDGVAVLTGGKRIPAQLAGEPSGPQSSWAYESSTGDVVAFNVDSRLKPTGVIESWGGRIPGARFWVDRVADSSNPFRDEDDLDCATGIREDCTIWSPLLPADDRIEIAFRSSWIRPLNVAVRGRDFTYRTRPISGGTLFTMAAKQDVIPRISSPAGTPFDDWTADAWMAYLNFIIDHAGTSVLDSAYDPRCAKKGAPVAGHNAPGAGRPYWDHGSRSLNFAIQAPHHGPDGEVYRGYFQAQIPLAWLRCEARQGDLRASGFSIRVVSEDGEEQAATTSLTTRRGVLHVQAFGFHYSSPTVQLVSKKKRR